MNYSAIIRTLGTAGENYQKLLDSLETQTIKPQKILVYIPYGYPLPKETIGREQYIRCEKGMVAQRSLDFKEVDTEYVLFLDDDLYLPPNLVASLYSEMQTNNGDCIVPNLEDIGVKYNLKKRLMGFIHNYTIPNFDKRWAVRIRRSGAYAYDYYKDVRTVPTQSANFACIFTKMSTHNAIHFQDERWLDSYKYASCDDQLYFYKMNIMGYRVLLMRESGIKHLDSRAGGRHHAKEKMYMQKKLAFVIWYRTLYNISDISLTEKIRRILAYVIRVIFGILVLPLEVAYYKQPQYFIDYFKGIANGWSYVRTSQYREIPTYDAYKKVFKV